MDSKRHKEADRWMQIAENLISDGALANAENALRKSLSIHPTKKAEDLLEKIKIKNNDELKAGPSGSRNMTTDMESQRGSEKNYSDEDVEMAIKISETTDYYEILGVSRHASDVEIRTAYKNLALKFHPDKSSVPGGSDAFKAIGKAASILTNEEKRKHYDEHGTDLDEGEPDLEELAKLIFVLLLLQRAAEEEEKQKPGFFRRLINCLICRR